MLELKNISFSADDKKILDNISLTLEDNKIYVMTGANGSGKSTLSKVIMGITKEDSGSILLDGVDITDLDISERANLGMAYCFQAPTKFKGITTSRLLELASNNKVTTSSACDYLSEVGLCARHYVDREVNDTLSGGERKRIEIATTLARNCKFNIFDEPEAGIDIWSFDSLINTFNKFAVGKTLLIISHQQKLFEIADKIIVLDNGKVKEICDSKDFVNRLQPVCGKLNKEAK